MESKHQVDESAAFIPELRECAKLLIEKLQADDLEAASGLIHSLVEVRDRNIYTAVGKLTRELHTALVNFHIDSAMDAQRSTTPGQNPGEINDIRDASERLGFVIEMTERAADKTMDVVEETVPIALNIGQEASGLAREWARLKRREMEPAEFRELYKRVDAFFGQTSKAAEQLNQSLQDILLAQDFQDLTGQVIKRVINLVQQVEQDLVSLVKVASQVEDIAGIEPKTFDQLAQEADTKGEGPQIHAKERADVVSGQDDVDDLLSSLGF